MMLSTHNLKHLDKIPQLKAQCLILNLEDGVALKSKPYARVLCAMALSHYRAIGTKLVVRINPLDEGGWEEIAYLNPFAPDAIRIPKVRSVAEVQEALSRIDPSIDVHLSIETAQAWLHLHELACDPRVKVFYLGILDLFAQLGLPQTLLEPTNPMVEYILSHFLVTSHALGVKPVSFVYQDHRDMAGLEAWLRLEKRLGYRAKGAISPAQVQMIDTVFADDAHVRARAQAIKELWEAHQGEGGLDHEIYGFIDEPIYKGALADLEGIE